MAGVSRSNSAILFSLLRLSKLDFPTDVPVKLSLERDIREGMELTLNTVERAQLVGDEGYARRIDAALASDLCGIQGYLQLPTSFGQLHLGETLLCYVAACNNTGQTLYSVEIVLEILTSRSKAVLYENREKRITELQPDERCEFLIKYDIKDVGEHQILCNASFTTQAKESVHVPTSTVDFVALAPLSIHTKVRSMGESCILEACLEGVHITTPLVLDYVRFDPVKRYSVKSIDLKQDDVQQGPLKDCINDLQMKIIGGQYCSRNFLFRLDPVTKGVSQEDLEVKTLGKLEIRWKTGFGGAGRLQTQQIQGHRHEGSNPYEVQGHITNIVSPTIIVYRPFQIVVCLTNLAADSIGPIAMTLVGDDKLENQSMRMYGPETVRLNALHGGERREITISLVSFRSGIQMLTNLRMMDEFTGGTVGVVASREIFVEPSTN